MVDFKAGPIVDQIFETTTTEGFADIVLNGAKDRFDTFGSVYADGQYVFYREQAIVNNAITYENGVATYDAGNNALVRQQVFRSSNDDNPVDWPAGEKQVFTNVAGGLVSAMLAGLRGSSAPAWLPVGGLWVDDSSQPWQLKVIEGSDGIELPGNQSLLSLPGNEIGQVSSDLTLNLAKTSVFAFEPTADIAVDAANLAPGNTRAIAHLMIKNGGDVNLTFAPKFGFADDTVPTFSQSGTNDFVDLLTLIQNGSDVITVSAVKLGVVL